MRKIAIVGGGIAGISCAYFLCKENEISLFEKSNKLGGHANTVFVNEGNRSIGVDTGFMVYNKTTYPHFSRLLEQLDIPGHPACMSFSVQHEGLNLEWSGTGMKRAFADKRNWFNPLFWRLISEIDKFNKLCLKFLEDWRLGKLSDNNISVKDFARQNALPNFLLDLYVLPLMSSLWSAPPDTMKEFPILLLSQFMQSHGLLSFYGKLDWLTIKGGSYQYVDRMSALFKERVRLNSKVESVFVESGKVVIVTTGGDRQTFDLCIFACHADDALKLLPEEMSAERKLLSHFIYKNNIATLHTDENVMPSHRGNWASWNYHTYGSGAESNCRCHYWMNSIQNVSERKNYFVTMDNNPKINESQILTQIAYKHPVFKENCIQKQTELELLNKDPLRKIYFTGSYHRFGFHEDALSSSVLLCRTLSSAMVPA